MPVPPLVIIAAGAVSLATIVLAWSMTGLGSSPRRLIASNLQRGDLTDLRELTLIKPVKERTLRPAIKLLARWVRSITPAGSIRSLERKLVLAARSTTWPLERVLAAKIVLGAIGLVLALLQLSAGGSGVSLLLTSLFAVVLYFAPDVVVSARATERQREILVALPDSLDQMTICMEAGLGFDAAMARTSKSSEGALAQEFRRVLQEVQVGVGRREALRALAERNRVHDLRHFVTAVLQSEHYGVPIADVLRTQAKELRTKRRQRAEEAARKLPLKLLFPLVLFILPPLFIILVGPAALQLAESFGSFGQ